MFPRAVALAALICSLAACGRSEQQQAEEAAKQIEQGAQQMAQGAQQSSEQFAQGLQQMAQGFQQLTKNAAPAVDFEQLRALLPEVDGWTRSDAKGEQLTMPVSYSRAQARYAKDTSQIELEITDTALSQLLLAPMSMFLAAGYSERSDEGFKRSTKIAGQPGIEEWNTTSRRGEVTAVIGNRFVVHATGRDVASLDVVRGLVESVDLSKLATLK
jgi:hypothetical protein